jgi:hypothetical protein
VPAAERRHRAALPRVAEHGALRRRPAPPVPVAEPLGIPRSLPAAGHAALAALVSAGMLCTKWPRALNLLAIFARAPVVGAVLEILALEAGAPLLTLVRAAEVCSGCQLLAFPLCHTLISLLFLWETHGTVRSKRSGWDRRPSHGGYSVHLAPSQYTADL